VTLKPRLGSLKLIENYIIQSGTHDFLLMFHSNIIGLSRTVSEKTAIYVENRQFFLPPVYLTPPLKGFPWDLVSAQGSEETRMMGLPDGRKRFKIGLGVLIQYERVTDSHPASLVVVSSTHYAYLRRAVKSAQRDANTAHYLCRRGPSSTSLPNLKRMALFVQKLLGGQKFRNWVT